VLAKLSASLPPAVRIDTGMRRPMALHTFSALVGRTGGFKTSACEAAEGALEFTPGWPAMTADMSMPVLTHWRDDPDEDVPFVAKFGTAAGIVENFWDEYTVELPVPEGARRGTRPKTVTRRRQVRTNVLLELDEGNALVKTLADSGSTVGETLRELWSGLTTGQGNATKSAKRKVKRGGYTFGMIVGLQVDVLARLLFSEEVELGTTGRFLYLWTGSPDIPDEPVEFPDILLDVTLPHTPMTLCPELLDRVRQTLVPLLRTGGSVDGTSGQRMTLLIRTAGLLAILNGRSEINEEDWSLAETVVDTSDAVAAYARAEKRRKQAKDKRSQRASDLAAEVEAEDAKATPEGRIEARIMGYLAEAGGRAKWSGDDGLNKRFNGPELTLAKAVLDQLNGTRVTITKTGRTRWITVKAV
jgi:hypothetical protein